jgi:ribosome maturation factor RimP
MKENLLTKLNSFVQPVVTAMGYILWGLEIHKSGRHTLLRIYIDTEESTKNNGVSLDDCSKVSRQISALLDVENPISHSFTLEVSSPGVNRGLFTIEQYQKFVGTTLKIRLLKPEHGQRNYVGYLKTVKDSNIIIVVENQEFIIPFASIDKANLVQNI